MKKFLHYFSIITVLILFFGGLSNAAIMTFDSQATFFTQLSTLGYFDQQTLDFESQTAGDLILSGNSVDGVTFTYSIGGGDQIMVDDSFDTTSPFNYIGLNNTEGAFIYGDSFTMTFDHTVHAVGLYVITDTITDVLAFDLVLSTGVGAAFNSVTPDVLLSDGNAFFIGLIEDDLSLGFIMATLSGVFPPDEVNYIYNVDDITTATVPIPSSLLLLAFGLSSLSFIRRKIKK